MISLLSQRGSDVLTFQSLPLPFSSFKLLLFALLMSRFEGEDPNIIIGSRAPNPTKSFRALNMPYAGLTESLTGTTVTTSGLAGTSFSLIVLRTLSQRDGERKITQNQGAPFPTLSSRTTIDMASIQFLRSWPGTRQPHQQLFLPQSAPCVVIDPSSLFDVHF